MAQSSSYATVVKNQYHSSEVIERAASAAQMFGQLQTRESQDPLKLQIYSDMHLYWQRVATGSTLVEGSDARLFAAVNALIQTLEYRRKVELPKEIDSFDRYLQDRELTNEEAQHVDSILAAYRQTLPGSDDATLCNARTSQLRTEISDIGVDIRRLERKAKDNKGKWDNLQRTNGGLKSAHQTHDIVFLFDAEILGA